MVGYDESERSLKKKLSIDLVLTLDSFSTLEIEQNGFNNYTLQEPRKH